uniref:Uncharacterized protein n=1 Tax=Knipowitschia caucasica TaxID=637954 RepID=A0AAV2MT70_KNICA
MIASLINRVVASAPEAGRWGLLVWLIAAPPPVTFNPGHPFFQLPLFCVSGMEKRAEGGALVGPGPSFCFLLLHAFHGEAWLLTPESTHCAVAVGSKGKAHLWHPSVQRSPAEVLSGAEGGGVVGGAG